MPPASGFGSIEEFSYSVSHDLRAPVRAMKGYADALWTDFGEKLDEQAQQYLKRIISGAERMDNLIMDVLTFSRVAQSEIKLEAVQLNQLITLVIHQYPALQAPHAQIEVAPLPCVLGHEPSLVQVVSNLLTNATKFMAPGVTPQVRVWGESKGSEVQVWFEDNGIGIAPEHQQTIFGLFERIHPANKYPGTGVGLAVVRKALERVGGQCGVESDGVNGSKFWISLQLAK